MLGRKDGTAPDTEKLRAIRRACTHALPGHGGTDAADTYAAMAEWMRENGAVPDVYGRGKFINGFEEKVAGLLGKESGVFMPSGVMAQQIALRIWSDEAGCEAVAMHPTGHPDLHENKAYAHLHRLRAVHVGPAHRPIHAADLKACADRVSTLMVELPIREAGGQLMSWDELEAIKAEASRRGIRLHLDGARLWETRCGFDNRPLSEICEGFDSVYVSFYKGIGGLTGALLAGPAEFIRKARVWQRRHGGNLYQLHPYVVSAAMNIDRRMEQMPAFFERAKALAEAFSKIPGVRINPPAPQVNMMHVHIDADARTVTEARNRVAEETRIWVCGGAKPSATPGWSYFELYVGESALSLDVARAAGAFEKLVGYAHKA